MRFLKVLFLVICLSLIPFTVDGRELKKYTPSYNSYVSESLGEEIYSFVGTLEDLENTWDIRRHIIINIFGIIDKYNCSKKLYIINRGLQFDYVDKRVRRIRILIYVMTSLGTIDTVALTFDIEKVKEGEPIKKLEKGRTIS